MSKYRFTYNDAGIRVLFLNLLLGLLCFSTSAQDIHFSQFYLAPVQYNCAETGIFNGDYRAGGAYRSQWSAVPVSYATTNLFGDFSKSKGKDRLGMGFVFNHDVAGDSRYGTSQFYIPFAYHFNLSQDSNLFFGIGIQPGIANVGFRTNKLTFDSQYDGDAFNPGLSSGENFSVLRRTYFDINSGIRLQYNLRQRSSLIFGLAYSHFNKPKISFYKNDQIRLDPKLVSTFSFTYPIHRKVDLYIDGLLNSQGKYRELVSGLRLSYRMSETIRSAVNAGVFLRTKDAILVVAGLEHKQWTFGLNYDINTSKFIAATQRRGAIEFALIYVFAKEKLFVPKKRACPIYM